MTDGYNGWTNYETWRVNLEVLDGLTKSDFVYYGSDFVPYGGENDELADRIEDYVYDIVDDCNNKFVAGIARSFLNKVNWQEIAENMMENADDE